MREAINAALTERQQTLQQAELCKKLANETVDITLPGRGQRMEVFILLLKYKTYLPILYKAGFQIAYGPEVEDDYHNFEALNIQDITQPVPCTTLSTLMQRIYFVPILRACKFEPWKPVSRQFVSCLSWSCLSL